MSVRSILIAAALAAVPTHLSAQEALKRVDNASVAGGGGAWSVDWSASAEPTLAIDYDAVRSLDLTEVQDEGEYALAAKLSGPLAGLATLSFTPRITRNPHLFDDGDEASAWSIRSRLARTVELTDAEVGGVRRPKQDELIPFIEHSYGRNYADVFRGSGTASQSYTGGITLVDVLAYLCARGESPDDRNCRGGPSFVYKVTLSYTQFDSDNDDKDREGPKLSAELRWPILSTSSLWLDGAYEQRDFDSLLNDAGTDLARSTHVNVTLGIDLSRWARRTFSLGDKAEFGIGVRWVNVEADRSDLERNDLLLVPTFSQRW